MIDWLTVELPDPVGIPINDGQVMRLRPDGTVEWATQCRRSLEGSWSSAMTFRAIGAEYTSDGDDDGRTMANGQFGRVGLRKSGLEISGNPAKFLTGHNLYGSDDCAGLIERIVERAKDRLWPDLFERPRLDLADAQISRIDLTGTWQLDREADVIPFLRAMEERVWCPYRGRGVMNDVGTLYYGLTAKGKRAKDWQLKIYSKGRDITVHRLPSPAYSVPGLLDDVNRWLRVELTLRTAELKRLDMRKVGDWTPAKVREIWEEYVNKLDFGESSVNLDTADLGELGLKARHVHALAAWKAGNDLRSGMSRASFYRLRKELKETCGFDIAAAVPRSNVVPLRRVVTAQPALLPHWANHLDAALLVAA